MCGDRAAGEDAAVTFVPQEPQPSYSHLPTPATPGMKPGLIVTLVLGSVLVLSVCWIGAIGAMVGGLPSAAPTTTAPARNLAAEPLVSRAAAPSGSATPALTSSGPVVITTRITETEPIPYQTVRINDSSLAKGKTVVKTAGKAGVRTLTYDVTTTDGVETAKKLVESVVTTKPVDRVIRVGTKVTQSSSCHPSYSPCVPYASDVDCAGGSGNGPAYVSGPIKVIGPDVYDLDRDGDGWACE